MGVGLIILSSKFGFLFLHSHSYGRRGEGRYEKRDQQMGGVRSVIRGKGSYNELRVITDNQIPQVHF
jgi:hypothetical protein